MTDSDSESWLIGIEAMIDSDLLMIDWIWSHNWSWLKSWLILIEAMIDPDWGHDWFGFENDWLDMKSWLIVIEVLIDSHWSHDWFGSGFLIDRDWSFDWSGFVVLIERNCSHDWSGFDNDWLDLESLLIRIEAMIESDEFSWLNGIEIFYWTGLKPWLIWIRSLDWSWLK
jgi:hypothetical protein